VPVLGAFVFAAAQGVRPPNVLTLQQIEAETFPMRNTDIVDLSVARIMSTWPSTIRTFLDRQMHCVGCPIAPFHTLPDAAREHGLVLAGVVTDIERQVAQEQLRGGRASGRHR
jgi:hybrid cluster-associated redox disulfide protein